MAKNSYTLKLYKAKDCKHSVVFEPSAETTPDTPNFVTGVYIARACIPENASTCTLTLTWQDSPAS